MSISTQPYWQPLISLVLLLSPLGFSIEAKAQAFEQIFVFGDSLSDTGNVYSGSLRRPDVEPYPVAPYYEGRFSDGPLWVDYVAEALTIPIVPIMNLENPFFDGGLNFAFGGAKTGSTAEPDTVIPDLSEQVAIFDSFLTATHRSANPAALYIIWAGGNDYLPSSELNVALAKPDQPIANVKKAIEQLTELGAQNIALINLPNLGKLPATADLETANQLTALTQKHNERLQNLAQELKRDHGLNLRYIDINSLFEQVLAQPQDFGLLQVSHDCLSVQCPNPEQFLFFDAVHPTTQGHQIIANFITEQISQPFH